MGHDDPFRFSPDYQPGKGSSRFLVGTPSVIANAIMEAALDIWAEIDPSLVFAKHAELGDLLVRLAREASGDAAIEVASPISSSERGGFVALRHQAGAAVVGALTNPGLAASFPPPPSLPLSFTPLSHPLLPL